MPAGAGSEEGRESTRFEFLLFREIVVGVRIAGGDVADAFVGFLEVGDFFGGEVWALFFDIPLGGVAYDIEEDVELLRFAEVFDALVEGLNLAGCERDFVGDKDIMLRMENEVDVGGKLGCEFVRAGQDEPEGDGVDVKFVGQLFLSPSA